LSYLASLGSPFLSSLTSDPVLHFQRLWVISPSKVNHHLFGRSKEGHLLRPSVGELVQRGVMKGLGIERRWRLGLYLYSLDSILQYESGLALCRRRAQRILTGQLSRRIKAIKEDKSKSISDSDTAASVPEININARLIMSECPMKRPVNTAASTSFRTYFLNLHSTHILPDIEGSSPSIARSLLPTMRKLKWSLQRDRLAREFKKSGKAVGLGKWLDDGEGEETSLRKRVFIDGEKVRLAVCPDMKKRVGFFEKLAGKV